MYPKLIPLNVKTRPSLRQMVRTGLFNLQQNLAHKTLMFRSNWGLLSAEERQVLEARLAFCRRARRSIS